MLLCISILLLSSSVLCYEIIIIRLLSISHWQPFITLAISTALLGFGISGSLLVRTGRHLFPRRRTYYPLFTALAALAYRPMLAAAGRLSLDPGLIIRDLRQWLMLALLIICLTIPFTLASAALALPLLERDTVGRYYGWNLAGACTGCLLALAASSFLPPAALSQVPAAAAAAACIIALLHFRDRSLTAVILSAAILFPAFLVPAGPVRYGPYKDISYALLLPEAEFRAQRWGMTGHLQVVQAPAIRSAAGLSTGYRGRLPPQAALFRDGDRVGTLILAHDIHDPNLAYLGWQTATSPYKLLAPDSEVAIVGFDGGEEAARALIQGISRVTIVEPDPAVGELILSSQEMFREWIFSSRTTSVVRSNIRTFLQSSPSVFDAVIYPAAGSLASASVGLTGTAESYGLTVEGVTVALKALRDGGIMAINGWNQEPPTGLWKLLNLLRDIEFIHRDGSFSNRVVIVRGWSTHTVLIRPLAFSSEELAALKSFCSAMGFSMIRGEDFNPGDARLRQGREEPWFDDLDLRPSTDNRPYPWHSLNISFLGHLVGERREAAFPRVEWGFFFLIMALVLSVGASVALMGMSRPRGGFGPAAWPFTLYFSCLGVGYMAIEIMVIKRSGLLLTPPTVSAAAVLAGFLLFSGLGSLTAGRFPMKKAFMGILFIFIPAAAASAYLLMPLFARLSEPLRILLIFLVSAPCAYLMGFPFPAGLSGFRKRREELVPWAWAVSGYTSVVGISLAGVLAVTAGFGALLLMGAFCYVLAGFFFGVLSGSDI